jgi:hypothetical protein
MVGRASREWASKPTIGNEGEKVRVKCGKRREEREGGGGSGF